MSPNTLLKPDESLRAQGAAPYHRPSEPMAGQAVSDGGGNWLLPGPVAASHPERMPGQLLPQLELLGLRLSWPN